MGTGNVHAEITIDEARLKRDRELLGLFAPHLLHKLDAQLLAEARPVAHAAGLRFALLARTHRDHNSAESFQTTLTKQHMPRNKATGISGGLVRIRSRARGAAIVEFAGDRNPHGKTPRGRTLIETLNERYGEPGRVLWQAWDDRQQFVLWAVRRLVEAAETTLQTEFDARL